MTCFELGSGLIRSEAVIQTKRVNAHLYQRFSSVIWMRLPQVSFNMAILDAVTSVGGMVNSAPRAFMRS